MVVYDAAGRPIGVLQPVGVAAPSLATDSLASDPFREIAAMTASDADPIFRMVAEQAAMMRNMMTWMDALAATPVVTGPAVNAGPGQMLISTFSSAGQGSCSETITYRSDGAGAPVVSVRRVGDACGSGVPPTTGTIQAATPQAPPTPATPSLTPRGRLYDIDYLAPPARPHTPPRG